MTQRSKRAATNRLIQETYLSLLERGEEVRVTSICETAGINRGTFYLHYKDIIELQECMEEEAAEHMLSCVPNLAMDVTLNKDFIHDYVQQSFNYCLSNKRMQLIFFNRYSTGVGVKTIANQARSHAMSRWTKSGITAEKASILFTFTETGIYAVMSEVFRNENNSNMEEIIDTISQFLAGGLMSWMKDA